MSRNYYSEINLHAVWHTKLSRPMLTPAVEAETHHYLKQRLINTDGVYCHEIGGTETHVHVVLTITPTVLISDLIGQLKGSSSHEINKKFGERQKVLEWQSGYGVVSFGKKDLPWVKDYVRHQKQHHAQGKVFDRLERFVFEAPGGAQSEEAEAPRRETP